MNDALTVVPPGAKNEKQARDNAAASALPPLADETMAAVKDIYDKRIAQYVDQRW